MEQREELLGLCWRLEHCGAAAAGAGADQGGGRSVRRMEIRDILPKTELLAQMAEEAAELSQAALKLRRALDGANPTPVPAGAAWNGLLEEYGDVLNCGDELLTGLDMSLCAEMRSKKMVRWKARLKEKMGRDEPAV